MCILIGQSIWQWNANEFSFSWLQLWISGRLKTHVPLHIHKNGPIDWIRPMEKPSRPAQVALDQKEASNQQKSFRVWSMVDLRSRPLKKGVINFTLSGSVLRFRDCLFEAAAYVCELSMEQRTGACLFLQLVVWHHQNTRTTVYYSRIMLRKWDTSVRFMLIKFLAISREHIPPTNQNPRKTKRKGNTENRWRAVNNNNTTLIRKGALLYSQVNEMLYCWCGAQSL